jgi:hypothetical protein
MRSYVEKSQFIKQSATSPEKKTLIYYDSSYQNEDKESKSYSLMDTLDDKENATASQEEIRQQDIAKKINNSINSLPDREMILLVRLGGLGSKITPNTLLDIYYLATEEEKEKLRQELKLNGKKVENNLANHSCQEKKFKDVLVVQKYLAFFSRSHKFSEIAKIIGKPEGYVRKLKHASLDKLQKVAQEENLRILI